MTGKRKSIFVGWKNWRTAKICREELRRINQNCNIIRTRTPVSQILGNNSGYWRSLTRICLYGWGSGRWSTRWMRMRRHNVIPHETVSADRPLLSWQVTVRLQKQEIRSWPERRKSQTLRRSADWKIQSRIVSFVFQWVHSQKLLHSADRAFLRSITKIFCRRSAFIRSC